MNNNRIPQNLRRQYVDDQDIDNRTMLMAILCAIGSFAVAIGFLGLMIWILSIII